MSAAVNGAGRLGFLTRSKVLRPEDSKVGCRRTPSGHSTAKRCVHENLLPERAELTESPLLRGDRVCGAQFVLHGPRSLRLTAIWDADRGRVLCYDARGERFLDVLLANAGEPAAA